MKLGRVHGIDWHDRSDMSVLMGEAAHDYGDEDYAPDTARFIRAKRASERRDIAPAIEVMSNEND
jgi:hypothetical protein